jgi:hypothetical protein
MTLVPLIMLRAAAIAANFSVMIYGASIVRANQQIAGNEILFR